VLAATSTARADARTILVFPFENLSSDRTLDWLGEGIAELIIERLRAEPEIYVFAREERMGAYEKLGIPETTLVSRATSLKLGWDIGADTLITGRFSRTGDEFEIVARVTDLEIAGAADEVKASGKLEDVISLTSSISSQIIGKSETENPWLAIPRSAFENYIRGIMSADPQKRIELLQTAVRFYPQYTAAIFQLGRALHLERDFKASNQSLEKIAQGNAYRQQAQFTAALNYFYLGDYPRAVTAFQALPANYDVLLDMGAALSQKGDYAGAMSTWRSAADIDPLQSNAFFNMGYASFVGGELDAAVRNLNESLKLRGRDSEALFLLGRAYERQGRPEESQRLISLATRLSQRVERWLTQPLPRLERINTSTVFRNGVEIWTAKRLARKARGQDLSAWLDAIQTDIDSNLYGEAIRELQEVVRVFPDSAEARSLLDEVNRRRNSR
jgi:tetratricopeptide (TPR) repeat protein/TolB-like protein